MPLTLLKKSLNNMAIALCCAWLGLTSTASIAQADDGLLNALNATLMYNPAIRGKQAEVASKNYMVDSAKAQRYPTLSAQANALKDNTQSSSITARQPIWAFGRIDNTIAYADVDVMVNLADLARIKQDLIDKTATAYARVQGVMQKKIIAQQNVAALTILYEQIQRRENAQLASIADVRLANARRVQAIAQQVRFEGEYDVAQNELIALTQIRIQVADKVDATITQLPDLESLLELSITQSATIAHKKALVDLAKADAEREKTRVMPTVYLQAQYYKNYGPSNASDTQIGINLEANLEGMGFAAQGRNSAFVARVNAASQDLKATENEIKRAVNSYYRNREAQQGLIQSQQNSVAELSDILASYQRQYEAGKKAWLEVLNIQRELTEQSLQLAQAQNEWLIYSLKLAAVIGQLEETLLSEKETANERG